MCLIGANEVGKSTALDALELGHGEEKNDEGEWIGVSPSLLTRGEDIESSRTLVRLRYRLSKDEKNMLRELPSGARLRDVRWMEVTKRVDGAVQRLLDPVPTRDKTSRHALGRRLAEELNDPDGVLGEQADGTPVATDTVKNLVAALDSNNMYLPPVRLSSLGELAEFFETEERSPQLVAEIRKVVEQEELAHPLDEARDALRPLIPQFVRFELRDRELADEYNLANHAASPPASLLNLARLAGLDLEVLLANIEADITGNVQDMIRDANDELERRFSAWTQKPPVKVSIDTSGVRLLVHVQSGAGPTMKIRERSEGLRQFVALVALTAGEDHEVPPILLIDEAERQSSLRRPSRPNSGAGRTGNCRPGHLHDPFVGLLARRPRSRGASGPRD